MQSRASVLTFWRRLVGALTGCLVLACAVPASDAARVAVMVKYPFTDTWGPADDDGALILGCFEVLGEYVRRTPEIELVGPGFTSGIQKAVVAGLYFPTGATPYERWSSLFDADVYVELKRDGGRLTWHAHGPEGTESRTAERPRRAPKKAAAALVRAVFAGAGAALPEAWEEELADPETDRPALFYEWAKWIGYRPHWAHHAPWQGPRESAARIIKEDPEFRRGMVWALHTMRRQTKRHQSKPTGEEYFEHAFAVLDSPFHRGVVPLFREWVEDPKRLALALRQFGLAELEMSVSMEEEAASATEGLLTERNREAGERELPTGPRLRRNLALALAGVDQPGVLRALTVVAREDEDASVRAAATEALAAFPPKASADALRERFAAGAAGEVRAAALSGLASQERLTAELIETARTDSAPAVRRALALALPAAGLEAAAAGRLLLQLAGDEDAAVRVAALEELRELDGPPPGDAAAPVLKAALADGGPEEKLAALAWIGEESAAAFAPSLPPLLQAADARVRARAGRTLAALQPERLGAVIEALRGDASRRVQVVLAALLARSGTAEHREELFGLLPEVPQHIREQVCNSIYRLLGQDRRGLARAMRFDPSLRVNLEAFRTARLLGDEALRREILTWSAAEHHNEYMQARALRRLEAAGFHERLQELCRQGLAGPFWVVRLEAADILSRHATAEDAPAIRRAREEAGDEWLRMALEDALCKAEGKPLPQRQVLPLGEREHTEGGHRPGGFQTWVDRGPEDPQKAMAMVREGFRFGAKTQHPDLPAGMVVRSYNIDKSRRNSYLIDAILQPLEEMEGRLPHFYYLALFDEPGTYGRAGMPDEVRAFLLAAGRPDLLDVLEIRDREKRAAALPGEYQEALEYWAARQAAVANNWIVHLFHLTGCRKYPGLRIFPQTLSYMRRATGDAFDVLEADGDYSWIYHRGNYFRDGSIGAVNRVVNPGKPLCMITWMGWHRPNIINGNTLYATTDYPMKPWRLRGYFGLRSALALWATGTEAGFFDVIGLGKASNEEARSTGARALRLHPYSPTADEAVRTLMDDPRYWETVEGKIEYDRLQEQGGEAPAAAIALDGEDDGGEDLLGGEDGLTLEEDVVDPVEEALQRKKEEMYEHLMTGLGYMNIFGTDTTRALSNLPKPDTRPRETLIILGRRSLFYADGPHFPMPAIAVVQGYDMAPTYDCVDEADLLQYDTVLLREAADGVTSALVEAINRYLREKKGGLLIVNGAVTHQKTLFPMVRLDRATEPFLWEGDVRAHDVPRVEKTRTDRRGRKETVRVAPPLASFVGEGGSRKDPETRLRTTYSGKVQPLLKSAAGQPVLARWQAPPEVQAVVLFDGAASAGPVYTEALEQVVLAVDEERGSTVRRNRWWGHIVYETDAFVVDVATTQLHSLQKARPRRHRGVDIVTGVINPVVERGECALVLKDYVGPYAGGKGDWAVMARHALKSMKLLSPTRLEVHAVGPTRVSHIGEAPLRLENADAFSVVENQVQNWKSMRDGVRSYCTNAVEGGRELHFVSPEPVVIVAGG